MSKRQFEPINVKIMAFNPDQLNLFHAISLGQLGQTWKLTIDKLSPSTRIRLAFIPLYAYDKVEGETKNS